jgi:hypothetical protein
MDQPQPGEIIEGARTIRRHLEALVGEQAASVDGELTTLLEQAQQPGQQADAERRLLFVLSHHDATREWLFDYIKHKQQPEENIEQFKSFEPLPGPSTLIPFATYCCPACGYKWVQFFVGAPVPQCSAHHISLVLC